LIPPEEPEPVPAEYPKAPPMKRKAAKSKLGKLATTPPVSLLPRTGSGKAGKQKQKLPTGTARKHKVGQKAGSSAEEKAGSRADLSDRGP